ncbi:hypothetical protein [Thiobacillus sp.]|uniref:hypothetical protein n=1 Tax=Thiobacillus sp. TaxID=924 RepID=UPI0025DECF80|nr:hypothetical protein [Thiobacillus sp.]MBT9538310.1 hypothetical protein [Thiobacillus sp.]
MDGNIVDIVTVMMALLIAVARLIWKKAINPEAPFDPKDSVMDFLNGALVVPFLLLFGSVFSDRLLAALLETNKLILGLVGVAGFFVLIRELLNKPVIKTQVKRTKQAGRQ